MMKVCKYDKGSSCNYGERFGGEPDVVDCLLCWGSSNASIASRAIEVLASVGAKKYYRDFLGCVLEVYRVYNLKEKILEEELPDVLEKEKSVVKKERDAVGILSLGSLPVDLRKALDKFYKRKRTGVV